MDSAALVEAIIRKNPDTQPREGSDTPAVKASVEKLVSVLQCLRDDPEFGFDMLFDHMAVDWLEQSRFELMYRLFSTEHGHSVVVSADVPRDNPVAPTVSGLWRSAMGQEREVYDLLGVLYDGHPDLRRVFLDDDWKGHPLRKDYSDDYMLQRP